MLIPPWRNRPNWRSAEEGKRRQLLRRLEGQKGSQTAGSYLRDLKGFDWMGGGDLSHGECLLVLIDGVTWQSEMQRFLDMAEERMKLDTSMPNLASVLEAFNEALARLPPEMTEMEEEDRRLVAQAFFGRARAHFRHLKLIEISTLESFSNLFEVFQCPSILSAAFFSVGLQLYQ
eukprot:symbB.v1.2.030173.t1/scaffold3373.1/size58198/3